MKKILTLAAASLLLSLSGCAGLMSAFSAVPASPAAVANTTVLDEQAALGVELAYKAARIAMETAVDAGILKGARATQLAAADNKAYAAIQVARRAYQAGNATDYQSGVASARLAVADLLALLK